MAPQLNITVHRLIDCESISSAEQTKEQSFKPLTDKTNSTHTPDLEESKNEINSDNEEISQGCRDSDQIEPNSDSK